MTLIAAFRPDGVPICFGDIIIARKPTEPAQRIELPSLGQISSDRIADFRQKVAIVGDNIAVAWGGSAIAARWAIGELRRRVGRRGDEFDESDMRAFAVEVEDVARQTPLSLVGFLHAPARRWIGTFACNALPIEAAELGRGFVAGSGASKVFTYAMPEGPSRVASPGEAPRNSIAFLKSVSLTGVLLQDEVLNRSSEELLYGGAYQVATLNEGKAEKIGDITHILLRAVVVDGILLVLPPDLILRTSYDAADMIVQTLRPRAVGDSLVLDQSLHVITEIDADSEGKHVPDPADWPEINSRMTCVHILAEAAEGRQRLLALSHIRQERDALFTYVCNATEHRLSFTVEFQTSLVGSLRRSLDLPSTMPVHFAPAHPLALLAPDR